jgi:hypothetical protein
VLSLAGATCDEGGIKRFRQYARSRVSELEQVGEHSGGIAGWRASCDRLGIRGGATGSGIGDEDGNLLAQAVSSAVSASSISASAREKGLGIMGGLHFLGFAPGLFGSVGFG